jgi:hypothetical protein
MRGAAMPQIRSVGLITRSAKPVTIAIAAALTLVCGVGAARAVTIQIDAVFDNSPPASPFALMTLPGSGTNQFITATGFTSNGVTVSFGGGNPASGEYAGNVAGMESPFGANNSTGAYLGTGGTNGLVTVTYATPQTALNVLWGSVDGVGPEQYLNWWSHDYWRADHRCCPSARIWPVRERVCRDLGSWPVQYGHVL